MLLSKRTVGNQRRSTFRGAAAGSSLGGVERQPMACSERIPPGRDLRESHCVILFVTFRSLTDANSVQAM